MGYRILVINWQDIRNPLGGGAEVHCHEIFKRIAQQGHDVTLLCSRHRDLPSDEVIDGIRVIRRGHRYLFNFWVPWLYRQCARQQQFDVVIDDINKIPFFTPLYVREPLIGIIHHLFGSSIFLESTLPVALYVTAAESLVPSVYRNIPLAVVSNSTKQELMRKGFRNEQISLVQNAVEAIAYPHQPEKRSPTPVIGYLGRIKKYKSVHHLLQAFAEVLLQLPSAELLVVGDGDYLPQLKRIARRLGIDGKVQFTGATTQSTKIDLLNRMWLAINPSPKEGWGLTVIEANSCGVPVIAADSPGLRDSVVNGKTGFLYPYGDYHRLAQLIIQLIRDDRLRNSLVTPCREWARQFNWEESARKMLALIEYVLSRR
ncbi:MAG: glycosyltransferase family 4 protein [candidate division KSB1 bacterium]|nr:glycosyltransferase family 4 protein [candidate division KSB1 bacterium]MDZ7318268.1 glycosyltransferase family 4 protein [candidate division KSB1 bacterium]MDZ7340140.1 glycosyltransferase family 4 protein [candidate division KSB1 bacterium]